MMTESAVADASSTTAASGGEKLRYVVAVTEPNLGSLTFPTMNLGRGSPVKFWERIVLKLITDGYNGIST